MKIIGIYKYLPSIYKIFIAGLILTFGLISSANGATLDSSGANPQKILKCQPSIISANFTGVVAAVTLYVNNSAKNINGISQSEYQSYAMTDNGGGYFTYTYGNDATLLWGNKSLAFKADTNAIANQSGYIFVYSDECTGANIAGYKNTTYRTGGFGNNTRLLFTGQQNIIEFAQQPFLTKIGYTVYVLLMFLIIGIIYMKNQSVISPIIITLVSVASLVSSSYMPEAYRLPAMFITAVGLAAIFWRLGKSA